MENRYRYYASNDKNILCVFLRRTHRPIFYRATGDAIVFSNKLFYFLTMITVGHLGDCINGPNNYAYVHIVGIVNYFKV